MTLGVAILYAVTLGPGPPGGDEITFFMALTAEIYAAICAFVPVSGAIFLVTLVCAIPEVLMLIFIPSLAYTAEAFGTESSTGKAATLTVMACIIFFAMHLVRVRLPRIGPIGLLVQLLVGCNLGTIYWSTGTPPPMTLYSVSATLLAYALATLFVVYFLLVPSPSGPQITILLAALTGVVEKMGSESGAGVDKNVETCMELDWQAGQLMVPLDGLLLCSKFEVNVYGRPHIFPTKAFEIVYKKIGFLSRLMVHNSRLDRSSIPGIDSLHAAEQAALRSIKECLLSSNHNDVQCWDTLIQNHRLLTWEVYSIMKLLVTETSSAKREAILTEGVGGWLVTKAIEGLPGCFRHHGKLLGTPTEIPPVDTVDWKFMGSERAKATLQQAMEDAYKDLDQTELATGNSQDDDKATPPTAAVAVPIASPPQPATSRNSAFLFRMAEATGFHRHMFILTCQATAAFLVGCILTVNSSAYNALGTETSWIFIAVCVLQTPTTSGALHKAAQRLLGTLIGVTVVCLVAGFNWLCAGLSYKSTPTSLALSCTWLALYTGLALATREAVKPHLQYAIYVGLFVPLLLFTYDLSDKIWYVVGQRILNNVIGIGLVTVFGLAYPVTTRSYIRHTVAEILKELAQCVEGLVDALDLDKKERDKILFKHNVNIEKHLLALDGLKEELNLEKSAFFTRRRQWFQGGGRQGQHQVSPSLPSRCKTE